MEKHNVWTEIKDRPPMAPISSKWVFKIKRRADGSIDKYKARLCVRGFTQKNGIDYNETLSSVLKQTSLRILLSIAAKEDLEIDQADVEKFMVPYRQIVGALLYLVSGTRPNLSFSVSQVCRFMHNPGRRHWEAVQQIIRYLKGTQHLGLVLGGKSNELQGYVDSDHGGDKDTKRSTTGYIFYLFGGAISWNCKTQPTVALSSTEAEYMALSSAAQEAMWLEGILKSYTLRNQSYCSVIIKG
jgi:hypothetical protein